MKLLNCRNPNCNNQFEARGNKAFCSTTCRYLYNNAITEKREWDRYINGQPLASIWPTEEEIEQKYYADRQEQREHDRLRVLG